MFSELNRQSIKSQKGALLHVPSRPYMQDFQLILYF